jgi:hypothetical protein
LTTNWFCCRWLPILRVLLPLVTRHWCSTRFDTAGQCVRHVKHCFLSTFCWPDNRPSWHPYYIDWLSSSELAVAAFYYLKTWFFPSKLRTTSNALSPNLHHQILYSVDDGFDSTTTIPCNLNPRTIKIA